MNVWKFGLFACVAAVYSGVGSAYYVICPGDIAIYSNSSRTAVSFISRSNYRNIYCFSFLPFHIGLNDVTCRINHSERSSCTFVLNIKDVGDPPDASCSGSNPDTVIWIGDYQGDVNDSLSTTCSPPYPFYQYIYNTPGSSRFNIEVIRQCVRGICRNGGECSGTQGVTQCNCQGGYVGTYCEKVTLTVATPEVTDQKLGNGITFSIFTDDIHEDGPFEIVASLAVVDTSTPLLDTNGRLLLPVSEDVAIDVYNNTGKKISVNCEIRFPGIMNVSAEHQASVKGSPTCLFMNDDTSAWSTEGCETVFNETIGSVICKCNHLTSFAILMDISPSRPKSAPKMAVHDDVINANNTGIANSTNSANPTNSILSTLSNVGLAISTIFLIITLITICGLKDLRDSERYRLLRHLIIALLCVNVFFTLLKFPREKSIMCSLLAGVVHYSLLVAFAWMLIISTDIYMKVKHPFADHERRFLYSRLIGWIGPIFIVVITAAVTRNAYASYQCWLGKGSIWSLIVPMCLTLVIVTVQLIDVGYITYKKSKLPNQTNEEKQTLKRIRSLFRGILLLTPTLGLSWIFGVIIIFDAPKAMDYIFVILNTMQGFFIWLSQCVFSNEVRLAVKKRFGKQIGVGANGNHSNNTEEVVLEDQ